MTALYRVGQELDNKMTQYIDSLSSRIGINVVRDGSGIPGFIYKEISYQAASINQVGLLESLAYPLRCFIIYLAMLDAADISDGKGVDKNSSYRTLSRENLKHWLQGEDRDPDLLTAMEVIIDEHYGFVDFQFY